MYREAGHGRMQQRRPESVPSGCLSAAQVVLPRVSRLTLRKLSALLVSNRFISSPPTLARDPGPMRRLVGALVVIALLLCLAPAGLAQSSAPAPAAHLTSAVH